MVSRPSGNQLWRKHVEIYTEVFRQALIALTAIEPIGENELDISRQLYKLVRHECFKRSPELLYPICETPIISESDDNEHGWKKSGRPDFSCRLKNSHALSYTESERDFHVECKCLGFPKTASWIYNKNYVNDGIVRFDQDDKRYGENVSEGIMIGYVLSMSPEDICVEVNAELIKTKRKYPPVCFATSTTALKETTQQLTRVIIKPVDFTLIHLWIVLPQVRQSRPYCSCFFEVGDSKS